MNVVAKSIALLGGERKRLPFIGAIFVFISAVDVLGIGLIGPFVSLVMDFSIQRDLRELIFQYTDVSIDEQSVVLIVGLTLILFFITRFFLAVWANAVIISFGEHNRRRLKMILIKVYQDMPQEVSSERNTAQYVHAVHTLTGNFTTNVLFYMLKFVSESLVFVSIFILLAWQSAGVVISLLSILGITALVWDRLSRRRLKMFGENINRYSSEALSYLREGLDGASEIRILGKTEMFLKRFEENAVKLEKSYRLAAVFNSVPKYLLELVVLAFVVFICSFSFLFTDDLTGFIPVLAVFAIAAVRLLPGITLLVQSLVVIRHNTNTVDTLYQDYTRASSHESDLLRGQRQRVDEFNDLQIKNLSFRYSGDSRDTLSDINLRIRAGESIGIIGKSGSGKSTLASLILGLLQSDRDAIFVNDIPLSDCLASWQTHLAVIPQRVFLLDASVAANVSLEFDTKNIDRTRLDDALEMASIRDWVNSLPFGVESSIGENGNFLSGGQRQRLILARAFYHNRDFLIMDEATSALDSVTEEKIITEIANLKRKVTMVVIAHRRSTIEHCDHVFEIIDGKMVKHR